MVAMLVVAAVAVLAHAYVRKGLDILSFAYLFALVRQQRRNTKTTIDQSDSVDMNRAHQKSDRSICVAKPLLHAVLPTDCAVSRPSRDATRRPKQTEAVTEWVVVFCVFLPWRRKQLVRPMMGPEHDRCWFASLALLDVDIFVRRSITLCADVT